MSIQSEINRIKAAVAALAASITNKGVTVPDGTKLDGMAALVDSIQQGGGGGDFQITDASYLFSEGARWDAKEEFLPHLVMFTNAAYMFSGISRSNVSEFDISGFDFSNVEDAEYMFGNNKMITSIEGLVFGSISVATNMFYSTLMTNVDTTGLFAMGAVKAESMFESCTKLVSAKIVGRLRTINSMFAGCSVLESIDLSGVTTDSNLYITSIAYLCNNCKKLKTINLSNINLDNVNAANYAFNGCTALEEIIGFAAPKASSLTKPFPIGTSSAHLALKRLVFRNVSGGYGVRTSFSVAYDSFDRSGMVEMFNSLPDITPLNLSTTYRKITITGNPCVTDGTLTDADRASAAEKGWTIVE